MQNHKPIKIFFIVNPVSGGKVKNDWEKSIRDFFKDRDVSIEFYVMTGNNDSISINHHIETLQPERVVAVGGDGTVHMLANILKGTNILLGIIPSGSANGMARELNIPLKAEEALGILMDGYYKKVDLIGINNDEVCLHLSDVGLNAMLVKYFERSKGRGMWNYGKAVFRVLWEKQKMKVTIHTGDKVQIRYAYMVVIANARKYGTGANINPDGDIGDGVFEIVVVRKLNLFEILKAIFTDHAFHPKRIEIITATDVTLNIKRRSWFQVDGEFLGKTDSIHAFIMPGVLKLIVPHE